MMTFTRRVAINPLPWILGDMSYRLDREVLGAAMTDLGALGYSYLTLELPPEMAPSVYGGLLAAHGFAPAPGYFAGDFHDPAAHSALIEDIRRHAAAHVENGVDSAFIAAAMIPQRLATPAIGAGGDIDWPRIQADGFAAAAEAAAAEGVRYGLHPHVGSAVEVEEEVRTILDLTEGSALGFGPDTGHLVWAGIDPARIVGDYADRVSGVHLKDVNQPAIDAGRAAGEDYMTATGLRHVWTEPGRGSVDFDAVFAALPAGFNGWFIVEVDVPDAGSPRESSRVSWEFLQHHPFFAGVTA